MHKSSGNIIFIIFIAVALFAALGFAISSGNRTGNTGLSENQADLDESEIRACNTAVAAATKRLRSNSGCKISEISYELPDGTNVNSNSPSDQSCHLFQGNGAGLKPCGYYAQGELPCLLDLEIGESCSGIVYAGQSGGDRLYTTPTNVGERKKWSSTTSYQLTTANDNADGQANTDKLIGLTGASDYPYLAAEACRALGPKWYLPAINELSTLYNNRNLIGNFPDDFFYHSSTESATHAIRYYNFNLGSQSTTTKNTNSYVRCTRRY